MKGSQRPTVGGMIETFTNHDEQLTTVTLSLARIEFVEVSNGPFVKSGQAFDRHIPNGAVS